MRPTPKAFSAHLSMNSESLPPENSRAGRSKAAATSRRMKMVSSSSASRWLLLRVCSGSVMAFIRFSVCLSLRAARSNPWIAAARGLAMTGLFLDVQPAFLGGFVFPPPAPGAEFLAQADGPCAGRAADAREKLVVQRVVVHLVLGNVVPHIAPGPFGQRVELVQTLDCHFALVMQRHLGAGGRLFLAQSGDPGCLAGQCARQRLHLADAAAFLAQIDALVDRVLALVAHELDHRFLYRAVDRHGRTRMRLGACEQRQGFGVQR